MHTIYGIGLYNRANIVYVGCSASLPVRVRWHRYQNPVLKHFRKHLIFVPLAVAKHSWDAKRRETWLQVLYKRYGMCQLNVAPSGTVSYSTAEARSAFAWKGPKYWTKESTAAMRELLARGKPND